MFPGLCSDSWLTDEPLPTVFEHWIKIGPVHSYFLTFLSQLWHKLLMILIKDKLVNLFVTICQRVIKCELSPSTLILETRKMFSAKLDCYEEAISTWQKTWTGRPGRAGPSWGGSWGTSRKQTRASTVSCSTTNFSWTTKYLSGMICRLSKVCRNIFHFTPINYCRSVEYIWDFLKYFSIYPHQLWQKHINEF